MSKMEVLDKSYFENAIKERIVSLEVGSGSKAGDNAAGCLKCVKLRTVSGKTLDFVVKLLPELPGMHNAMLQMQMMEHEVNFYRDLLPSLESFLSKHGLSSRDYLPFPGYLGGGTRWLVLEDLRPKGFEMADKYSGLDFSHVSLVMKQLARFHASGYAYIRYRGTQIFEEFSTKINFSSFAWYHPKMEPSYKVYLANVFSRMNSVIREKHSEVIGKKLDKFVPRFVELFDATHAKTEREYFSTIALSDIWVNNIMFLYEDGQVSKGQSPSGRLPVSLKFLDLQQVKRGNIFEDLEYFFATSTTPKFREKFLIPSLQIYHQEFEKTVAILECPMPIGFTFGFLIDNYYKNLLAMGVFIGMAVAFQLGRSVEEDLAASGDADEVDKTEEDAKSKQRKDCIVLTPLPPFAPLGSHFVVLESLCYNAMLGEPRALQRFIDIIDDLDKLCVFDENLN